MFRKKSKKGQISNIEKLSNNEDSDDQIAYESEINNNNNNNNNNINNNEDNLSSSNPSFIEEEEEPSISDNSTSINPKSSHLSSSNQNDNYIDSSELSILKKEIESRFDIQPNFQLPLLVENSLGAISDSTDSSCKNIKGSIEELSSLTDEIIQKSNECNNLILRLNDYTVKVSKDIKITQQSIQQIRIPRRSLLQILMLFFIWIINLIFKICHKIKYRNSVDHL